MADCGDCVYADWDQGSPMLGEGPDVCGCNCPHHIDEAYIEGNGTDFDSDDPDKMDCQFYSDIHGEE